MTAENYLAQGNTIAASNTLRAMASTPPKAPADAGKLARLLAESGDLTTAVSLVRNNISSGVSGNAGDYADQIAVLNQAGLTGEAQNLISNPQLQGQQYADAAGEHSQWLCDQRSRPPARAGAITLRRMTS